MHFPIARHTSSQVLLYLPTHYVLVRVRWYDNPEVRDLTPQPVGLDVVGSSSHCSESIL